MFTFAHLYKAAMVDRSKANLLTNEAANGAPRPLLRRRLEFRNGLPQLAVLLQNQSRSVQGSGQRSDLLFGPV